MRSKIFICCKIGAKTREEFEQNLNKAKMYSRWAVLNGYDPESTGFYYSSFLDDFSQNERKLSQELGRERLKKCESFLIIEDGKPYSQGMIDNIETAKQQNQKSIVTKFVVKTHQEIIDWLLENDHEASKKMFPSLLFEENQIDTTEKSDSIMDDLFDCYD